MNYVAYHWLPRPVVTTSKPRLATPQPPRLPLVSYLLILPIYIIFIIIQRHLLEGYRTSSSRSAVEESIWSRHSGRQRGNDGEVDSCWMGEERCW